MAVQGSRVPKFGGWGSGENAPNYTIHFTKAREDKVAGKMINPNDPQQNPHVFPNTNKTKVEPGPIRNGVRGHVRRVSKEDGEFMQVKESAARNDKMGKGAAGDQSRQQSRTKSANRGDDETREGGALIPPFGKWDEKNPESEDFTGKFEKVQIDRNEPGKPPSQLGTPTSSFTSQGNPNTDDSAKTCCFPWCRK